MRSASSTRKIRVWVASLAILLGALAPSITHALNSLSGSAFLEVCTTVGSRFGWSVDNEASAPKSGVPVDQAHHCPFCVLHASAPGMPPAPLQGLTLLPLAFHVPELFLAAPRTLNAWTTVQARAPPHHS